MNDLEKRMYFLVPYNISPIQQAIQAGHAALKYAHKYGNTDEFHDFVVYHQTWIILNGGTTNNSLNEDEMGTLNKALHDIIDFNAVNPKHRIKYATFNEPDLNNALTAICLIVDERVFNREDYSDFEGWMINKIGLYEASKPDTDTLYEEYKKEVGDDIVFLKELLNTKKLA